MKKRQCRGCGAYLQATDPNIIGYLPAKLLEDQGRELICQRCFRIKHYGENILPAIDDPRRAIKDGLNWADGLIVVTDLIDFEASFPELLKELCYLKPTVILVNKVDLLPPKTGVGEAVEWVKHRLAHQKIKAAVLPVSGVTGFGIEEVAERILASPQANWLVLGVTNTGKSTLLGHLLKHLGYKGNTAPTVSRFPGTTVERIQWNVAKNKQLSDSPGFIPEGRVIDYVPESLAPQLVPAKQLNVKLYSLGSSSALVIPGLAAVIPKSLTNEVVMIGITGSEVEWQRSNQAKVDEWLTKKQPNYGITDWTTHEVTIPAEHDLIIHGLGWVSIRKQSVVAELVIPEAVQYSIRPNLVGKK